MTTSSNALALIEPTGSDLALPEDLADVLAADAANDPGFKPGEMATPWLRILQNLSPQVKQRDPAFIPGAQVGDFFNALTGQVYPGDPGIVVVPVHFTMNYVEWRPRSQGGGFVADHGADPSILQKASRSSAAGEKARDTLPNGNEIVTSGVYYLYVVNRDGTTDQVVLALSSTQLKKARRWNGLIQGQTFRHPRTGQQVRLPMYAVAYKLSTVVEKNQAGEWMGLKVDRFCRVDQLPNGRDIYQAGKDLQDLIRTGVIEHVTPAAVDDHTDVGADVANDIPF